ncbi:MAG: molybdopterin molybdotransferase MoeA [Candidatus Nezhaarchaeales archaeon]
MIREDWKRVLKLTSPEEAAKKLLEVVKVKPRTEEVSVVDSLGRVLAENIIASQDVPPYDCACFEGYAVRSKDTSKASRDCPVKLKVIGKVLPETRELPRIKEGEAAFLVTGAPIPPGADALVKVEETRLEDGYVLVFRKIEELENVAVKGEDIKAGEPVLRSGHTIRPIDVGLLMGLGISKVKVYVKPRFAILSVGKELYLKSLETKDPPPNNYAYVIKGLIEELGGLADVIGILPDDVEAVKEAILKAINEYDVLITMGSCSIGINDTVPDAINELGELGVIVHGLTLSPGKPAGFGVLKGKPIIMLPGHIVSAVAAFYSLCLPLIAYLTGRTMNNLLPYVYAEFREDEEPWGGYRFLRARVEDLNGNFVAKPMHGGANVMTTLLKANYFVLLPPKTAIKKGDKLRLTALSLLDSLPQ